MVPNVSKAGHSFKGVFAYLLHDKRQEGEARRDTSNRVGWIETRNLATADPEIAKRIMVATALQANELKRAAGVRNTGRKSTASVYSYSLAWHPDERGRIDRDEMVRAADASLKAIGAEHLQAMLVCHTDEAHPHVHIVVNRVDPSNGRMLATSNDFHKLEAFALAYRAERGEELKYCPARKQKADAKAANDRGEAVPFVRGAKAARPGTPAAAFAAAADPDQTAARWREKAADLAQRGEAMKARHSREWVGLSAGNKAAREAAYDRAKAKGAAVREVVRAEFKTLWRDLFRQQRTERKAFDRAGLFASTITAIKAAHELAADRQQPGERGWLRLAFMLAVSRKARDELLTARQTKAQKALAARQKGTADSYWPTIRTERDAELEHARLNFIARRAEIMERQAREKAAMRSEWRDLSAARDALAAARPTLTPAERRRDPDDAGRHHQTASEIRRAYEETVGKHQRLAARDQSRRPGRTRSRTRTRGNDPEPQA